MQPNVTATLTNIARKFEWVAWEFISLLKLGMYTHGYINKGG